jgi:hypothetical protein
MGVSTTAYASLRSLNHLFIAAFLGLRGWRLVLVQYSGRCRGGSSGPNCLEAVGDGQMAPLYPRRMGIPDGGGSVISVGCLSRFTEPRPQGGIDALQQHVSPM